MRIGGGRSFRRSPRRGARRTCYGKLLARETARIGKTGARRSHASATLTVVVVAFVIAIEIFLAILLLDDAWNVNDWALASTIIGAAYLISRGIAKASRVLEQ